MTKLPTVCPHDCPSACALDVTIIDGRLASVHGAQNSYTAGVICSKVSRYAERAHHPDRLTHPLERVGAKGAGQWRAISWDAALDRIAAEFQRAAQRHGLESVWPYNSGGIMGLVQRDGIHRLTHVMGYSRRKRTICTSIATAGWNAGVGRIAGPDPREMAAADLIVIWGGNPVATQVNVMAHVARARKGRGAKLVVVDPYKTGTAAVADMHLALRPGTDGALACAMLHILFRDGAVDRAYLARHAQDTAALEAHLRTRTPAWAADITGLGVDEIEAFAALYGRTKRSYIRCGFGFTRSRNGAVALHAVTCLPTVTGAWQHEGGGAFWMHAAIFNWDKTLTEGLDAKAAGPRELDMSRIGGILAGEPDALKGGPPVAAMLIQAANPAASAPSSDRVRAGLLREDLFVAVHELFMTDTAQLADIVLPATTFLEHDDIYGAGGHSHIQFGPAYMTPPGECRSNHDMLSALAKRLGAEHPGFAMNARAVADETLRRSGWDGLGRLQDERWIDAQPAFADSHFLTGFGHPDGRFRFAPDWAALGPNGADMPALPDHWAATEESDERHPFRLVAPPARQFLNTSFSNSDASRLREERPSACLNDVDAARLGITPGDPVVVGNARGAIHLHARVSGGQQPGVVVVESLWPHADFVRGRGINVLIGDRPAAPNDGAAFHDTAVWVRAGSPLPARGGTSIAPSA